MRLRLVGLCAGLVLASIPATADVIHTTYTGQIAASGEPFALQFTFDTTQALPGDYTNTGDASSLAGHFSPSQWRLGIPQSPFVGSATFNDVHIIFRRAAIFVLGA